MKTFEPVDQGIAVAYRKQLFDCYHVKHMEFGVGEPALPLRRSMLPRHV